MPTKAQAPGAASATARATAAIEHGRPPRVPAREARAWSASRPGEPEGGQRDEEGEEAELDVPEHAEQHGRPEQREAR